MGKGVWMALTLLAGARRTKSLSLPNKNPSFSSLIGDMASSVFGGTNPTLSSPSVDASLDRLAPNLDRLKRDLVEKQTPEERQFRSNLAKGYGVGSPLHLVRLFDPSNSEEDVRIKFYRDSSSWCPYCQKVWMTLEEKRIPYTVEKINMRCYGEKPGSFTRLQPSGNIPVAIIDGVTFGQSNDILAHLETPAFAEYKSLQPRADQELRAQSLLRLERKLFSAWMYWLTSGDYKKTFVDTLNEVEAELESCGPFFMGESVTLVDFQFAPFLERMAASLLYYKGFQMRVAKGEPTDFPNVNKWFDAIETLESYQLTKSDYYTHCWDLPPQLGGCISIPEGRKFEQVINGERTLDGSRGSWELPLQPHNGGVEPDWDWAGDEETARREAVERMTANFESIVKFAARGAGKRGMPSYSAPLADPNAVPNESVQASVGAVLRVVCAALLSDASKEESTMVEMAQIIAGAGPDTSRGVVNSLSYLRDRIGVPRDMRLPAARQLRAHLNWSVGKILEAQE